MCCDKGCRRWGNFIELPGLLGGADKMAGADVAAGSGGGGCCCWKGGCDKGTIDWTGGRS